MTASDIIWNADRRYLFLNPEVVIPEAGDMDDIESWLDMLKEKHGVFFAGQDNRAQRVRKLVLDVGSPYRHHTTHVAALSSSLQ